MYDFHISITFYQLPYAMYTGIIFIHFIYLLSKFYYVDLIRAKTAFPETLRNAWNLSTKCNIIQNLCSLSHYIIAYHVL